ncbi:PIN domain-containing protein [Candidatus Daviesbacteria bacterium]|nr:PIN domain-containing protein [Candidatus Daviesbacteria bacterium]
MLIDTNILVYAINKKSPKNRQARKFLEDNQEELILAHQNIIEAIKVLTQPKYSHPMDSEAAIEVVLKITEGCQIIAPKPGTEFIALELIKRSKLSGNRIFDAYLTATALSNGVDTIATDNVGDFKKFKEISVFNPFV